MRQMRTDVRSDTNGGSSRRREIIREALRQRVTSGLHLGLLQPGERFATAREVARELGADYRLVVAAARDLAGDGLLEVHPRAGLFIGRGIAPARTTAFAGFGARLLELLVEEVGAGVPPPAVLERVRACLQTVHLRAACIECNRDQLEAICHELRADYGLESTGVELDELRGVPPPAVRAADLLVSTSFHAGVVRKLARRLGKPCVLVSVDAAWRSELVRLLAAGPVCFIGTDPRWAAKARTIWGGVDPAGNLRTLTLGVDSVDDIPAEAAVMVMPGARRLLAGTQLLARALPARGFSRETARQILGFVVEANVKAWLAEAPLAAR
jgi:DNA-binding transcriptional regulator YhcF (GntR family)